MVSWEQAQIVVVVVHIFRVGVKVMTIEWEEEKGVKFLSAVNKGDRDKVKGVTHGFWKFSESLMLNKGDWATSSTTHLNQHPDQSARQKYLKRMSMINFE